MSKALDVYKKYFDESWSNPPESQMEAGMKYLSEDFKNLNKDGSVQGDREAYVGMGTMLFSAIPDLKWVRTELRAEGDDTVVNTGHFEGTHTGDLDLSALGVGVVPASGKKIVWPDSSVVFKVKGDKIVSVQNTTDDGTASFLAALGVKLPSAK
jgi:predicted ester cyclase